MQCTKKDIPVQLVDGFNLICVYRDLVMQCLDDKDESIRLRALDLINGMVSVFFHRRIRIYSKYVCQIIANL